MLHPLLSNCDKINVEYVGKLVITEKNNFDVGSDKRGEQGMIINLAIFYTFLDIRFLYIHTCTCQKNHAAAVYMYVHVHICSLISEQLYRVTCQRV